MVRPVAPQPPLREAQQLSLLGLLIEVVGATPWQKAIKKFEKPQSASPTGMALMLRPKPIRCCGTRSYSGKLRAFRIGAPSLRPFKEVQL
jgi:hypothetical protein